MQNGNDTKFYFKAEDLMALINDGATHIIVSATTDETGATNATSAEAYDMTAASKGTKPGCPWPCGGKVRAITQESLNQANQSLSDKSSY